VSARSLARALARLSAAGAVLAPGDAEGAGYSVFPGSDRRRRPLARLAASEVQELEAEGAIAPVGGGGFVLSPAGHARVRREAAAAEEAFAAQHRPITTRHVADPDGKMRLVRGLARSAVIRRLGGLKDAAGRPWLTDAELRAAAEVRADWEASEVGIVRGSDWSAPPPGSGARGACSAQERALAARCDARRRLASALDALAPPLRRVVESVCIHEHGIEVLERTEGWPARSGKLALKLGLAQLAASR
jgi:hypothetical protein